VFSTQDSNRDIVVFIISQKSLRINKMFYTVLISFKLIKISVRIIIRFVFESLTTKLWTFSIGLTHAQQIQPTYNIMNVT